MNYRLSNTAGKETIERALNLKFKYPYLYKPKTIIDGLKEVSIPIITMENDSEISHAIRGILPNNYTGKWSKFQNRINTLTVEDNKLYDHILYEEAIMERRCIVLATGFYTSYLDHGKLKSYLVKNPDNTLLYIAGIYNKTKDGFITCSIVTNKQWAHDARIKNLNDSAPIILNRNFYNTWLNPNTDQADLKIILGNSTLNCEDMQLVLA
ncbi:SOS response-associated peptidase family protein [Lacinutrix neustonica]|uniref:Abasic site processing protein n=1 Tax=Lacinutrix neustonica TaxID=2980107 RepID=A0A9E8MW39_9FLAO|nr:SOS response-associated peptidase family protein [Lacinutrix neustonica]WAC01692.1 SOS response-associated peptidase family protein [Lacinutrix neustonica]